jgi:hypothetical protein
LPNHYVVRCALRQPHDRNAVAVANWPFGIDLGQTVILQRIYIVWSNCEGVGKVRIPLSTGVAVLGLFALFTLSAQADCDAPTASWQPRSAVLMLAERNNWQIDKLKIDDGCYEVRGRDANGYRFKAKLNPATLEVESMKRERQIRDRDRTGQLKRGERK